MARDAAHAHAARAPRGTPRESARGSRLEARRRSSIRASEGPTESAMRCSSKLYMYITEKLNQKPNQHTRHSEKVHHAAIAVYTSTRPVCTPPITETQRSVETCHVLCITHPHHSGSVLAQLSSSEAAGASLCLPPRARPRPVSSQPACSESGLGAIRSALGDSSSGLRHSGLCRSGLSSSLSRLTPAEAKEGCSPLQRPSSVGGCCPYREPRGSARTARPPPPPSRL